MKIQNIPFRLESELVKWWYRFVRRRPSSTPFLSGDGYRLLTPWRYEAKTRTAFQASLIPADALVFCEAWLLEEFLQSVAPHLGGRPVVMASNGDPNFTLKKLSSIPPNVAKLWVQNCEVNASLVEPLPIGLENATLHANGIVGDFRACRRRPSPTKNRILWGFAEVTNPEVRGSARRALERCPVAIRLHPVNSRAYRRVARYYRFIASPPGNGVDCHRTWEAMYLGAIPIVIRSVMTQRFADLGLPLWLVDSYEELEGLTEGDLDLRYQELSPGLDHSALWMDYWKSVILASVVTK